LARAAVGSFTCTALVRAEPGLAGVTVIRHRPLREVLALVSADCHAAREIGSESGQRERD